MFGSVFHESNDDIEDDSFQDSVSTTHIGPSQCSRRVLKYIRSLHAPKWMAFHHTTALETCVIVPGWCSLFDPEGFGVIYDELEVRRKFQSDYQV